MGLLYILLIRGVGLFSVFFGLWLVRAPKKAIEFQIAFYRFINWRIEPLDWKREIHSTLVMGWTALLCGLAALVLSVTTAGGA